jgi:hypothetical protein
VGTFHDTHDPLHGITVVAHAGSTVYVGRCHERDEKRIVLHDADRHTEGDEGRTISDYLARAVRFGVWKKYDRLELAQSDITEIVPLNTLAVD